ncbi:MAG: helix-turn-helix domain-containing protein [Planctomycetaceae bacterium]|nr:helix-turn-helix domain-containing protein [Planctomycetaceae bacterium]
MTDKHEKTSNNDVLNTATETAKICGVSRSSLYKLVSSGRAPKPIKLGRASRWARQGILDWIAAGCPARERKK